MTKKYELLQNDTKQTESGKTLYRIKALKTIKGVVEKGRLGGYIEGEHNLSQEGDCWVNDRALVFGNAQVKDDAYVTGSASVFGDAIISNKGLVFNHAKVFGSARIYTCATVSGNAEVSGNAAIGGDAYIDGDAHIYNKKLAFWVGLIGNYGDYHLTVFNGKNNKILVSTDFFSGEAKDLNKFLTFTNDEVSKEEFRLIIEAAKFRIENARNSLEALED